MYSIPLADSLRFRETLYPALPTQLKNGRTKSVNCTRKCFPPSRNCLPRRTSQRRSDLPPADYQLQVQQIDEALTFHLRHRTLQDQDNQRLLDGIGLHQDRGNLLRFLREEGLEPTNNRAERALRPAVIARKVPSARRTNAVPKLARLSSV